MLFGIPKVKFDLKSQTVILQQLFPAQFDIATEENRVSDVLGSDVDSFDDDHF